MKKLKKTIKIGVFGCGCALSGVAVAALLLTGGTKTAVGWVTGAAKSVGLAIPANIKLPTAINLPKEIGLPPINLPKLPVNPFKLSPQEQIVLGREVATKQNLDQDAFADKNVSKIAARLVKALPDKYRGPKDIGGWEWKFNGLRSPKGDVNAIALPGGRVYVYDGLIKLTGGNENELAAVIGHEMAHVVEEHSAERMRNAGLLKKATDLLLQNSGGEGGGSQEEMIGALATQMGKQITQMQLSQSAEYQADDIGFRLMSSAGYDPKAGLEVMRKLGRLSGTPKSMLSGVFSTHPPTEARIARLKNVVGKPLG